MTPAVRARGGAVKRVAILVGVLIVNGALVALADRLLGSTVPSFSWAHFGGQALYQTTGMALYFALWGPVK